jgi:hypothetical protein
VPLAFIGGNRCWFCFWEELHFSSVHGESETSFFGDNKIKDCESGKCQNHIFKINTFALLTLRHVSYTSQSNLVCNDMNEVVFKKHVNKTTFLEILSSMEGISIEEKKDVLLFNVTWELLDGQHI